jgi:hypothetical protein
MTISHANLTGSNIHEPKGTDSATSGQIYKANGAGSGSYTSNINKIYLTTQIDNISTSGSVRLVLPYACTFSYAVSVLGGTIGTADALISFTKNGSTSLGASLTVAFSGSSEGDVDTFTPSSSTSFAAGDWVEITTNGASTGTVPLNLTLVFDL